MKNEVYFTTRDEVIRVNLSNVMHVSANGNYVTIEMRSGKTISLLASMASIEQVISNEHDLAFMKVGRSHLINLAYLSQINTVKCIILLSDDISGNKITLKVSKEAARHTRSVFLGFPQH